MKRVLLLFVALSFFTAGYGQLSSSRFDFGRMWTFENPPKEHFKKTYGFDPGDQWFDDVRKSALRFSTFCSASFISPKGLIMTNHHCSRGEVGNIQKEGEDFDINGFYASTLEEERKVDGLFVDQLMLVADVTERVKSSMTEGATPTDEETVLQQIIGEYQDNPDYKGLWFQPVAYYSGGRFSIYGYMRYSDIRLVLLPELQIGYFGGDPDNFTYPRYNLDVTLWRAYQNGQPLNTSDYYFKFNPDGIKEGEVVFVVGNPGSTERYRTMAQLEYDRKYRYPSTILFLRDRLKLMVEEYEETPSFDLKEQIFSFSNSLEAYEGIQRGLNDERLMKKKKDMEDYIRKQTVKSDESDYWKNLAASYEEIGHLGPELTFLGPSPLNPVSIQLAHAVYQYQESLGAGASADDLEPVKEQIRNLSSSLHDQKEEKLLAVVLTELQELADPHDSYITEMLDGKSPASTAAAILNETLFANEKKLERFLNASEKKVNRSKDPILKMSGLFIPMFNVALEKFQGTSSYRLGLEEKISNATYQVFGSSLPPDATFTLRISDGVVQRYDYNGTVAPVKTTFFGLYDKYYSNDGEMPWALPEKWLDPPKEILKEPLNFISTNDIIGGNSGSPMINRNSEVVGLIFDGNTESLPGRFIFDEVYNRTVSVHTGGILAAIKYIYKADRIEEELLAR